MVISFWLESLAGKEKATQAAVVTGVVAGEDGRALPLAGSAYLTLLNCSRYPWTRLATEDWRTLPSVMRRLCSIAWRTPKITMERMPQANITSTRVRARFCRNWRGMGWGPA